MLVGENVRDGRRRDAEAAQTEPLDALAAVVRSQSPVAHCLSTLAHTTPCIDSASRGGIDVGEAARCAPRSSCSTSGRRISPYAGPTSSGAANICDCASSDIWRRSDSDLVVERQIQSAVDPGGHRTDRIRRAAIRLRSRASRREPSPGTPRTPAGPWSRSGGRTPACSSCARSSTCAMLSARTPSSRTIFDAAARSRSRTRGSGSSFFAPRRRVRRPSLPSSRGVVGREIVAERLAHLALGQPEVGQLVGVRAAWPGLCPSAHSLHLRARRVAELEAQLARSCRPPS